MNFLIDFAVYLVVFGLGSLLTWLIARTAIPARTAAQAEAAFNAADAEAIR
jgi:hypothetical protein